MGCRPGASCPFDSGADASRLDPHRVELVHSTYKPTRAELGESVELRPMSLEEAARSLMEPVEIRYIEKPRRES